MSTCFLILKPYKLKHYIYIIEFCTVIKKIISFVTIKKLLAQGYPFENQKCIGKTL